MRRIDWESPDFGGHVHHASNGSWSVPTEESAEAGS